MTFSLLLWKERAYKILKFIGRRTAMWLVAGLGASFALGLVELVISRVLQLMLTTFGLAQIGGAGGGWVQRTFGSPFRIALILLIVGVARAVGQVLVLQSATSANEGMNARLRLVAMYDMLLRERPPLAASEVNSRIGEQFPKAASFAFQGMQTVAAGIQIAFLAAVMCWLAWREAMLGLVGLGGIGFLVLSLNRRLKSVVARIVPAYTALARTIERVARNWLLLKVLRTERREYDAVIAHIRTYQHAAQTGSVLTGLGAASPPLLGIVLIIAITWTSQHLFHTSAMTLLSFLYLFIRFVQGLSSTVSTVGGCVSYWPQFRMSAQYFFSFSREEMSAALNPEPPVHATPLGKGEDGQLAPPAIDIDGLTFGYTDDRTVVEDLSLHIDAGKQLAIVGPSGCGKSTLLALVLGLLRPSRGTVRVAGEGPRDYFLRPEVRVGYVGAEPFLIEGTLEDNLRYGLAASEKPDANGIWDALRLARLEAFVRDHKDGLAMMIGEGGTGLSSGQKQRLCLARALLNRPLVLVLDEVSANLDTATEADVAESLRDLAGKTTTIVVSHRAGILKYADRVVELAPAKTDET